MLAGFVAGEGSFVVTRKMPAFKDGQPRLRFALQVSVAERDRALLEELRSYLDFGSIHTRPPGKPHHLPQAVFTVASLRAHRAVTIPFADAHLLQCAKRQQFERWREALEAFDAAHPSRFGRGRSTCSEPNCDDYVRGRGFCRRHYYRVTGY